MSEFKAPSGASIVINPAPWKDAKALKKALQRELANSGLDFSSENSALVSAILRVDASDEVDAALWPCLKTCTRNNERITETTFDDMEARKDYYDVITACAKENLGPLAESLSLKLSLALSQLAQKLSSSKESADQEQK